MRTIRYRGATAGALLLAALVASGCSGGVENPTGPSATPFSTTLTGSAFSGGYASQTVNIPRAGMAAFVLTGFGAGQLPVLEIFNASGVSLGRAECQNGNSFCTQVTVSTRVQPGAHETRVRGGNLSVGGARYTVSISVN